MLSSKHRACLRALANTITPVVHIGKGGISPMLCESVAMALEAHELIKLAVLETTSQSPRAVAEALAAQTGAEVVSVIGRKIILYKVSGKPENRKVSLTLK